MSIFSVSRRFGALGGVFLALSVSHGADTDTFSGQGDFQEVGLNRVPRARIVEAAAMIDGWVAAQQSESGVTPNPLVDDSTFVRRTYLNLAGRIPTYEETLQFLNDPSSEKRGALVDALLESDAYVGHSFNYFADLLRIQSRMRNTPSQPYIDWVKDAIRHNVPYDVMVRELITAEGYIWDNGAAGFYLRDSGMPLDHMANTFQVFLGTQLVCAQCHDHPTDSWTQKDYYEQAAYSFGVKTQDPRVARKYRQFGNRVQLENVSPDVKRVARRLVQPLRNRVFETRQRLKLPDDYQYDDADPGDVVAPKPIFGEIEVAESGWGSSRAEGYARWMTSPENPRFATVIANRLWKRAMGVGLIEPVDDLSDAYRASNPALMEALTELMVSLEFDLKQFQRVLYHTQAYQRETAREEWDPEDDYQFAGPVLTRMSAEQLWDSMMTLIVPDVDQRPGTGGQDRRYERVQELVDMGPEEILAEAEQQLATQERGRGIRQRMQQLQRQIRTASRNRQPQRVQRLRAEIAELANEARTTSMAGYGMGWGRGRSAGDDTDSRWRGLPRDYVRASELASPAPPGHFLRQFGQSDRETIENASDEATVPQVLTLINGPMYQAIEDKRSVFHQTLRRARTPAERIDAIYLTLLSRYPSDGERQAIDDAFPEEYSFNTSDIVWAVLNTRQFAFVQ